MMKPGWFVLSVLLSFSALAQDTVIDLNPVQVSASRLQQYSVGLSMISFDSLILKHRQFDNLTELLASETPIYIKSYGQGSLATIAIRGTSAVHTGIYWNGISLNPATSALYDLSLAPSGLFQSVRLLEGGAGPLFGSGNIGGSIHLDNLPVFGQGFNLHVGAETGSFGQYSGIVKAVYSAKKIYSSTGVLYKECKNDFRFYNPEGERLKQKNAAFRFTGIVQDVFWDISPKWQAGSSVWIQSNFREIPATLYAKESVARQWDKSLRAMVSLRHQYVRGSESLKVAFMYDSLHYRDAAAQIESDRNSQVGTGKWVGEIHISRHPLKNSTLNTGINLTRETAASNNYGGNVSQDRAAVFVSALRLFPRIKWKANVNLRQEFTEGYHVPFTPSAGLEGKLWRLISSRINLSRNYRVPSFNELFWKPWGNPELKPENSWNAETGIILAPETETVNLRWQCSLTAFTSLVDNWILWIQESNTLTPKNIAEVWSRGVEFSGNFSFTTGRIALKANGGYTFTKTTSMKKLFAYDNSWHKQLMYIPEHRVFAGMNILYKTFVLNFNFNYTGKRYTTSDNYQFLPGYALCNLMAGKEFRFRKSSFSAQLRVLNLSNQDYTAVEFNPMPGRSYKFSINYKFNSK